jgi:hypothetical protein
MSERPACVDCRAIAPETNTSHTLISASFGWRLTRRQLPDGKFAAEWRCASCWRKHKESLAESSPPKQPPPAKVGSTTMRWLKRS